MWIFGAHGLSETAEIFHNASTRGTPPSSHLLPPKRGEKEPAATRGQAECFTGSEFFTRSTAGDDTAVIPYERNPLQAKL
jgi:hypothetical protein